jgi:hypothetical protein
MGTYENFSLPDPLLVRYAIRHGVATVVRDDVLDGGSKTRFLGELVRGAREVVFGGPFCGGAPLALSVLGKRLGFRVTLFYAKRKELHARQRAAILNGATIYQVPFGYMTNVQAKARAYAAQAGALFLPLGFDVPAAELPFLRAMLGVAERVGQPDEVWCAMGSGMLARCLGRAFPNSQIQAVAVGLQSRWEKQPMPPNVRVSSSGVPFSRESRDECPFPCCPNYDRKAWARCYELGRGNVLFWNVLG